MDRRGDFRVGRTIIADRRVDFGATAATLSATKDLDRHTYKWHRLKNTTTQNVILPNATTLLLGWQVVIDVPDDSAAAVNVQTYHDTTPATLKNIEPGRAYELTCVDISTEVGEWHVNFLEEADKIPTERYVKSFDDSDTASGWPTLSNGYHTITVLESEHERGTKPTVDIFQADGSDFIQVTPDRVKVAANGDVSIRVPENPDLRFEGEAIFI